MSEVVSLCTGTVKEVWTAAKDNEQVAGPENGVNGEYDGNERGTRPPGAEGVLWDSLEAGKVGTAAPTVQIFASSGLLG